MYVDVDKEKVIEQLMLGYDVFVIDKRNEIIDRLLCIDSQSLISYLTQARDDTENEITFYKKEFTRSE